APPAGLADRLEVVLLVADLADGRAAVDVHFADLARAQPELRIRAFAREELRGGAGRARELRALAGQHLDTVHQRADRNVPERQRVARLDRRFRARLQLRARAEALGRDDVAALAVGVEQEREVRASVRVIVQALDLGVDAVLVAPEIDQAVVLLVAAALVAHRDAALVVAAAVLRLALDERPVRSALVQVGRGNLHERAPSRRGRLDF